MATANIASIFFPIKPIAKIGEIQLHCSISETHSYRSTITDYPTEEGFYIQDNIYLNPFELSMRGIITDTPFEFPFEIGEDFFLHTRLEEALDLLLELRDKKKPFTVVTGLRVYPEMIFTSFEPVRDPDTGRKLEFTADLKQIRKAKSKIVEIPRDKTKDKKYPDKQNKGQQQPQVVPDEIAVPPREETKSRIIQLLGM